jgi:trk system potassium uptake protein TrkH
MSLRRVLNVVGLLQVFVAIAMALAGGVSLFYGDGDSLGIFLSAGVTLVFGFLAYRLTRFEGEDLTRREGYAIVTFAWATTGIFGALPYLLTGILDGLVPAVFESVSGFTTTGATVFADTESLPHGILFWRSFTQWLGGMGIIVLAIAVLPYLGVGGMQLFKAEVPGPTPERLRPRIAQTAKLLWYVYVGLTASETVLLALGGMSLFDAVNHSFTTLSTGGFSTRNASVAAFDSPFVQYVISLFMFMGGVNFALHFRAISGRPGVYLKDHELRFLTLVVVGAAFLLMLLNLVSGVYPPTLGGMEHALRDGLFQSTSITTTTGYATADYELWLPTGQGLLLTLMFVGGMAGSTGGSMKAMRVLLLLKQTGKELRKHLHPRAVLLTRIGPHVVKEEVLANVLGFVILYVFIFLGGAMLLTLLGIDIVTAIGASAATVGNVGPGVGDVGPTDNYGWMSDPGLGILCFLMIVGRLEIYTVLLLFHPDTWKRRGSYH